MHFMVVYFADDKYRITNISTRFIIYKQLNFIISMDMAVSKSNTHNEPMFRKLKIMTTSQLYNYFWCIVVFRSLNNLLPERLSFDLRPHFCTGKASEFSFKYKGSKIWNTLPHKIVKNY